MRWFHTNGVPLQDHKSSIHFFLKIATLWPLLTGAIITWVLWHCWSAWHQEECLACKHFLLCVKWQVWWSHLCRCSLAAGGTGSVSPAVIVFMLFTWRQFTSLVINPAGQLLAGVVESRSQKDLAMTTQLITLLHEQQLQLDRVFVHLPDTTTNPHPHSLFN